MIRRLISHLIGCGIKKDDLVRYTTSSGKELGSIHRVVNLRFMCGCWWLELDDVQGMLRDANNYKKLKTKGK